MSLIQSLSLSVYAFGYGCGFVKDRRAGAAAAQSLTLTDLAELCREHGLAGLEIPVDRYFPDLSAGSLERFIEQMQTLNLRVIFDLEDLSAPYFHKLAPIVRRCGEEFVRAKVCSFYGGNRFRESSYLTDKENFCRELQACVEAIDRHGVRVLVENHQDVTVKDLLEFAERFGAHRVGVNWDTGNSYPAGETTASFLEKTIHLIGNVHLKDYRLASSAGGYVMHRCAIGRGVVDFDRFVPLLADYSNGRMPFSIELGAMVGREALINDDRYWAHTEGVSSGQIDAVRRFVSSHLEHHDLRSPWENNALPSEILAAEFDEVRESIQFCKRLFNACSK
jgi:sugar phosphate isomerase/epimerase